MTKNGYEDTSVSEVRRILEEEYGVTDHMVLEQTKKPLVQLLVELKESNQEDASALLDIEEEESVKLGDAVIQEVTEPDENAQPAFNTVQWNEWVLRQFDEDELEGGAPTCDGLRRITETILGPISKVEIISSSPPNIDNRGNATVVVGVTISDIKLESHPMYSGSVYIEEIADASPLNTPPEIAKHPSATAASRAESRAYRKALRLRKTLTAEEANAEAADPSENWAPSKPITDEQINVIDIVAKRVNINVKDFINCGDSEYLTIYQVTEHTATKMLQHLNRIQRKDVERPDDIGDYDDNWRIKDDDQRNED